MTKYADEGSCAHAVAALCLTEGTDAAAYIGRLIEMEDYEHAKLSPSNAHRWLRCPGSHALETVQPFEERFYSMEVTEEMAEHVQVYVDAVRGRIEARKLAGAVDIVLHVEKRVAIDHLTGETGATGTCDVLLVSIWADGSALLDVVDLKFGRGVEVAAEENEQLVMYSSGALRELDLLYDIREVCLCIHQPRLRREPSEWTVAVEVIRETEPKIVDAAELARTAAKFASNWDQGDCAYLVPGEKQCKFCGAKAECPALSRFVEDAVGLDFENLDAAVITPEIRCSMVQADPLLPRKMAAVDLIEDWCRAVRAETERRLLAGQAVVGWKLVQGKRGARQWSSVEEAETVLKSMRLKQEEMYDMKLISPTTAEKVLKESPKRWARLAPLITQSEGKPSVAPESDKRPALVIAPVEDDFQVVADDLVG